MSTEQSKQQLLSAFTEWPLSRKVAVLAVLLISALLFGTIIMNARTADHALLFGNMPPQDASKVVAWLKDNKVPYSIAGGGSAVYVPANKLHETRLELAGVGLPPGGGVGFEIFDKQAFGLTDFAQKVNYQRAQQGELSRTIGSLEPVESARVHIVQPKKTPFKSQQKPATASVVLTMGTSMKLTEEQVQGIVHLVAGSVEGLESENVTVVNNLGRILSKNSNSGATDESSPGLQSHQQSVEFALENKAQSMLDQVLGIGNSTIRVSANLDFSKIEQTEEIFDPDGQVAVSENSIQETASSNDASGIPGTTSNLGASGGGNTSSNTKRTEELINYEISKTIRKTELPVGTLKNISIAVMVSDKQVAATSDAAGVQVQDIEDMVKKALGYNEERGDSISVAVMPFNNDLFAKEEATETTDASQFYTYLPFIKIGLLLMGVIAFYLILVKPVIRTISTPPDIQRPNVSASTLKKRNNSGLGGGLIDPVPDEADDAVKGAQIVKSWLKE